MKSEKVRTSILFIFSLLLFTFAASAETVEYWDPVGKVTNSVEAVVVTAGTETLTGGWYVVTGEVTFPEVQKPSDAAGFFTIGVSATKGQARLMER